MQTDDKKQWNQDQDPASRVTERNADKDPSYNKDTDKNKDPDSKTFNEDEASYENNGDTSDDEDDDDDYVANSGTKGNDWDANNPVERSDSYRYDDEERNASDYINSDHSNYNRSDSRFSWTEYDF
jgi:hypothetical protein